MILKYITLSVLVCSILAIVCFLKTYSVKLAYTFLYLFTLFPLYSQTQKLNLFFTTQHYTIMYKLKDVQNMYIELINTIL